MNKNTISKWFSMFVLMMVAGITGATAQSLTVADFAIEQGETKEIAISVAAAEGQTIYGIQTDITLSEGLTLTNAAAVDNSLTLTKNTLQSGPTRVSLLSQTGGTITAGDAIKLTVTAASDFAGGTIALTNSKLTTNAAGAEINVDNSTANVKKAITPVLIKPTTGIATEFTSIADLAGQNFAIINKAEEKALYGSNAQNLAYDSYASAFSSSNSGYLWKLVSLADDPDETVRSYYRLRLITPNGQEYIVWNNPDNPGYLNSQNETGWCSFILGLNNQNGQDIKNGAVFDIQYVEGQGFSLKNIGTGLYKGANAGTANATEPVYFTFATISNTYVPALKALLAEGAEYKAIVTDEAALTAYDTAIAGIDATAIIGDGLTECQTVDAAITALAKAVPAVASQSYTRTIVNPSFELGNANGWISNNGGNTANNGNFGAATGSFFVEKWTAAPNKLSDGSLTQVITGLPAGKYKLTAQMQNLEQGNDNANGTGYYLVANNDRVAVVTAGETVAVETILTEGAELTIGAVIDGCTGNWVCVDNFQLTYEGEATIPTSYTATFNFADSTFREKIGTAATDADGYIYNEIFTADGASLQVTSGSAITKLYVDNSRGQNLVTFKEYATLTFKAPEGKAITKIEFTAAGNSNIKNLTASAGAIDGMVWTGNAEGVRFTQGGTSYLANAILTMVDKTAETSTLPAIEYTQCDNIAAFNALEAGTYAKVTLTDAEVIGKSADGYSTVWVQDATGGCWIQYTSLNSQLNEKTKVNGTIYAIKREATGNTHIKEAEATVNSELNATDIDSYTVVEGTIDEVNVAANLNKMVKIAADSLVMTSATAGKLYIGETSIDVNNGNATANQALCKIADWEKDKKLENITIVAILTAKSTTVNQLLPISISETEVEPEDTYATVKMTYVDGAEEQANTAFGEVEVAKAGFNKIENGQVAMANTGWGCNWITYLNVDASAFKGIVKKAILTAEVSGSTDNKRTTTWGVGYNSSAWAADTTYNTADKSITVIGEPWTGSTKSSETFQEVTFDITEAFANGNVATILVYETAAAGGYIKNPKVLVEMGWPEIERNGIIYAVKGDNLFTNGSFDEGVAGWKTIGYTTDAAASDFTISNEGGYDGGAFITTNGAGVGSEKTIRQSVAVTEGKTYYFAVRTSGKAPAANNFNYNALFKMTDAATEDGVIKAFEWPQGADQTATEWSTTEHVFTAESGFVGVRMGWNQNSSFDGFELYELEMLTSALDAAKATKIAAIDALAPIGEGLFFYSQRSIDDAKAAVNAAETVEAVEAVAMPTPTVPAADKEYTFFNKQAQRYMTLSAEGISIAEEPYNLKFEAAEGGKYYVTDGTNYVGIAGTDNWSMTAAADKKEALTISATFVDNEAYYTLAESKGLVGVDYPKKDNMGCWANKGTGDGDAVLWSIAEKKDRFAITIAETQNGTAVAKPTTAAEGETVTLIATPAEGYMVDAVKVTYGESQEVELNKNATADTVTFVMPASAVTATFTFKLTPFATAKAALEATLAAAKAIETEGKNGADALAAAITPAETALTAADATVESLAAAKEALAQAISVFNKANLDADLIEIAQNQGKDIQDGATRATLVEGEGYNTYTTDESVCVIFKMYDVNVKDCDYVLVKFAEPVPAGIKIAFWAQNGTANVDVPAGATEYKYVFAEDNQCAIANDILPQITLLTLWNVQTVKVEGVYKHNTVIATGINTIASDAQKNAIFNLNGQKVNKAQRGLYIINGKRVVVK